MLLHHMETVADIKEYAPEPKEFQVKRLLRKLNEIRAKAAWAADIAPVGAHDVKLCNSWVKFSEIRVKFSKVQVKFSKDDFAFFCAG